MGAVSRMCKHLRFSSKVVGYAGTKDKRGVTAQWCTVKRKSIEELRSFNRPLGAFQVSRPELFGCFLRRRKLKIQICSQETMADRLVVVLRRKNKIGICFQVSRPKFCCFRMEKNETQVCVASFYRACLLNPCSCFCLQDPSSFRPLVGRLSFLKRQVLSPVGSFRSKQMYYDNSRAQSILAGLLILERETWGLSHYLIARNPSLTIAPRLLEGRGRLFSLGTSRTWRSPSSSETSPATASA